MKSHVVITLVLLGLSVVLGLLPGGVALIAARGSQSPVDPLPDPLSSPDVPWQRSPDGEWFMPEGAYPRPWAALLAPQTTGGPDDFGYTWDDSAAPTDGWVDASGGIDAGVSGSVDHAGPIDIGFPFKYYENTYTQLYISRYGFVAFNDDGINNSSPKIPNLELPNDVIAPFWIPTSNIRGYVRYLGGGDSPDRWFVVEWNQLESVYNDHDEADIYTFEVILQESGDISFQYGIKILKGNLSYRATGIEDSTGLDGLATEYLVQPTSPVVRIKRPAPSARVSLFPKAAGMFDVPGAMVQFNQVIRNTGDRGTDTYDLFVDSAWPVTFYQQDGITALIDTSGNGAVDTGPVAQGSSQTIVAKVAVPGTATAGQSNNGQLTVRSSVDISKSETMPLQVAVPAPFVQSYTQNSRPYVGFYRPNKQNVQQITTSSSYAPVVATTPDGNIVQVWHQNHANSNNQDVCELYYAVLDRRGNIVRPATKITDHDSAPARICDYGPAVAVTPDGHIGIVWSRNAYNLRYGTLNYNIYYMILNNAGGTVVTPTHQANDAACTLGLYNSTIAATVDNHFVMAWQCDAEGYYTFGPYYVWYTVQDSNGGQVKALTQFGDSTSYAPNLTPLADGSIFLTLSMFGRISYGRLDSAGNVLHGSIALPLAYGDAPDAVQLLNGNIVIAWTNYSDSVQYAMLNSGLGVIRGVTDLASLSSVDARYVSVTRAGSRAVLSWGGYTCCGYPPNLYYALLDGSGKLVTPPVIFAGGSISHALGLPSNGQGNTVLSGDPEPANPITLTSSSHTVNTWSNDNTVDVAWSGATDGSGGLDGYSVLWDHAAATVPDEVKNLEETAQSMTSDLLADGDWYFHIRAVDNAGNWASNAAHLGPFKIDVTPPKSSAQSPEFAAGSFLVTWSGTDAGSGITGYDVWVRDGSSGTWTRWQSNTVATQATYAGGASGHTYYFRSVARDAVGNEESDVLADGDTRTTIAAVQITGRVTNNRDWPILGAVLDAQPAALNVAASDRHGNYTLYFDHTGIYTLTASQAEFGVLPPRYGLTVNSNLAGVDWVLPPQGEAIVNGHWETGTLAGWHSGPGVTPTVAAAAAHTGRYGMQLNTSSSGTLGFWPYITQSLTIPANWSRPTLSFLYRVTQGATGDALLVQVSTGQSLITHPITLTPGDWTHTWYALRAFSRQTVTVQFGFQNQTGVQQVYLDEISLGQSQPDAFWYLPIVLKNK